MWSTVVASVMCPSSTHDRQSGSFSRILFRIARQFGALLKRCGIRRLYVMGSHPRAKQRLPVAEFYARLAQASLLGAATDIFWRHDPESRRIFSVLCDQVDSSPLAAMILGPIDLLGAHLDLRLRPLGDLELDPDVDVRVESYQDIGPTRLHFVLQPVDPPTHPDGRSAQLSVESGFVDGQHELNGAISQPSLTSQTRAPPAGAGQGAPRPLCELCGGRAAAMQRLQVSANVVLAPWC